MKPLTLGKEAYSALTEAASFVLEDDELVRCLEARERFSCTPEEWDRLIAAAETYLDLGPDAHVARKLGSALIGLRSTRRSIQ